MSHNQALQLVEERGGGVAELRFSPDQLDLLKTTIARGTTNDQFKLFCEVAQRTGLNPFAKQIYAVVRQGQMTVQTGVDGYRLIAQRTGEYAGQQGPFWCGSDGEWRDVWLESSVPAAAKVGVLRHGFLDPVWGVALTKSYMQAQSPLWKTMPEVMIAKCAEVLALRKAFPQELSGLYADAEMEQADTGLTPRDERPTNQAPPPRSSRPSLPPVDQMSREEFERDEPIEGEARDVTPQAAVRDEPPISRFWKDVRALSISREQVIEHLGHERFEEMDSDALGELLLQLKDKHGKTQRALV